MSKLNREDCASLMGFVDENWEQFVHWLAGNQDITEEEAEEDAERIAEHLEEGAK